MLRVSEIFYSLQGEGEFIGTPSVFLRLGGCNLTCPGFGSESTQKNKGILGCDSFYSVNERFSNEWNVFETSDEIIEQMQNLSNTCFDVILTGGEPSLQFKNPILRKVIEYFLQKGHRICVESNGSVRFTFDDNLKQLFFTLSPKLSNSGESIERRINIFAIQNIIDSAQRVVFKFVLNALMCEEGKALEEIQTLLKSLKLKNNRIFLMPQGTTSEELYINSRAIIPLCLQEGFSFSDRLHIHIWGDKRGF